MDNKTGLERLAEQLKNATWDVESEKPLINLDWFFDDDTQSVESKLLSQMVIDSMTSPTHSLPFQVGDLVRRTAIDYCPELDASEGITEGMVGEVAGIDYSTPMFSVHFGDERWGLYLTDELQKVTS